MSEGQQDVWYRNSQSRSFTREEIAPIALIARTLNDQPIPDWVREYTDRNPRERDTESSEEVTDD